MSDFLATDLRPSDSYLVIAAHLLWDVWIATGSSKHFLRATTILQMGVTSSPSNWQMKLLLIRFYNRLVKCSPSPNRHFKNVKCSALDVGPPLPAYTQPSTSSI